MAERLKNMKGITLIELLAVLVIIGIVAAIAIPAIGGILNDASTKADIATEKHLADAAKRYMLDYESKGVQYTYQSGNLVLIDVQNELVFAGYIEEMPGAQLRNNQKYRFVEMVKLSNGNWDLAAENYYPSSDGYGPHASSYGPRASTTGNSNCQFARCGIFVQSDGSMAYPVSFNGTERCQGIYCE
jgi:type IV pilus assembly protein PilA